ncbi:MAG: hypothetical protein EBR86_02540 [Planctomycetia bacterium]|nr:hypothetical protein [Planctomycetia bacterium]
METRPHRISLGEAWEPPLDPDAPVWVRRFGRPAGSAHPGTALRVWLVVAGLTRGLTLNGVALSPGVAATAVSTCEPGAIDRPTVTSYDVSPILLARNELRLVAAVTVPRTGSPTRHGRVALPEAVGRVWLDVVDGAAPDPP